MFRERYDLRVILSSNAMKKQKVGEGSHCFQLSEV